MIFAGIITAKTEVILRKHLNVVFVNKFSNISLISWFTEKLNMQKMSQSVKIQRMDSVSLAENIAGLIMMK